MAEHPVDLEELKELIKLLRESNVSEFEIRTADYRLRIKHGHASETSAAPAPTNGKAEALPTPVPEPSIVESVEEPKETLHEILSPMVGTFYRSSSPGSAPFIEVGDQIKKNQVLCIIEAMKIMNEIESDVDGEVRMIHASNGQAIEFGEVLFSIKPTS